jgi:hypothetical protein
VSTHNTSNANNTIDRRCWAWVRLIDVRAEPLDRVDGEAKPPMVPEDDRRETGWVTLRRPVGRRDVVWRYMRTRSGVSTSAHTTANPNNTSTVGFLT